MRAISLSGDLAAPSLVGVMILLDESGSMKDIKAPMETAFQQFVAEQRAAAPDGMWLSLHRFTSGTADALRYTRAYERRPLADVGPLTIHPSGGTPLRDALWTFGHAARAVIDDPADPTERLVLVIITDGGENTSRQHQWPEVRELIQGLDGAQSESLWLGTTAALLEAQAEVATFRNAGATLSYAADAAGASYGLRGMSASVGAVRTGHSARAAMADYTAVDVDTAGAVADDWLQKLRTARRTTNG